jgi:hypothetical protein
MRRNHHYGHINLVNCVSHGESWLIPPSDMLSLTTGKRTLVRMGTDQFWRVLSMLAGDCDVQCHKGCDSTIDLLAESKKIKDTFGHVVGGSRPVVGNKSDGDNIFSRLQNTICILKAWKERQIVVADVCPFTIYNGVNNMVKRSNQKTGNHYNDRKQSLSAKEHAVILRISWEGHAQHLVKYYNPMQLVVLGVGVKKAITRVKLDAIMQGTGGHYLGSLRHPSWNGYYRNNSISLFRELRKYGVECMSDCSVCDSVPASHGNTIEQGNANGDAEEAAQQFDRSFDESEDSQLLDGSLDNSGGGALIMFRESNRSKADLLTDDIMQYSEPSQQVLTFGNTELSIADLLTLPIDEEISHLDSHSDSSILANITSWLIDEMDTLSYWYKLFIIMYMIAIFLQMANIVIIN